MARPPVVIDDTVIVINLVLRQELLTAIQEITNVVNRLKPQHVGGNHAAADVVSNIARQQLPVAGSRPRNVGEVLNSRVWQPLSNEPRR